MKELGDAAPRRVGPYRLLAELGRGAMGRVYLGRAADGALVAVKLVRPQYLQDEEDEFRTRFAREVQASSLVSGGYTAAVIDSDAHADVPWLASEFVPGPTLHEAVGPGRTLPQEAVLHLAADLVSALADVHRVNLIHRDLKPTNVILAAERAKVIDFGIARAIERGAGAGSTITHTGWLLGTPPYMSPEQAESKTLTSASDVFSLGSVLYLACTGTDAFGGPSTPQALYDVVFGQPDRSVLPPRVREVVDACWAKDPAARPDLERLLELIGRSEPVARPWSEPVYEAIERQNAEVGRLVLEAAEPVGTTVAEEPPGTTVANPGTMLEGSTTYRPWTDPATKALPNEPADKPPARWGAVAAVVALVLMVTVGVAVARANHASHDSADPYSSASPTYTDPDSYDPDTYDPDTYDPDTSDSATDDTDPTDTDTSDPDVPVATTTTADLMQSAEVGDCYTNSGSETSPTLEEADCGDGTFKVVDVLTDTTDMSQCDDVTDDDWNVSSPSDDIVLCMSYQYKGDAFYADTGDCVYGLNTSGASWFQEPCKTGDFTVRARYTGTTDTSKCGDWPDNDYSEYATVDGRSDLDVLLCLVMNYPNAAGHATQNECLYQTGSGSSMSFETVNPCSDGNVVVTGRTPHYEDSGFCPSGQGWYTWEPTEYPSLGFTMCFRNL